MIPWSVLLIRNVVKNEVEKNLKEVLELSERIKGEQSKVKKLAEELAVALRKSSKFESIEKDYEKHKGEQLVLQNAVSNKLIMLVNEKTKVKDSISAEVGQVKSLRDKLKNVMSATTDQLAISHKQKESIEHLRCKIKENREKLMKIDFGAKVKFLSSLNREIEAETETQKLLDEILNSKKYGLKSAKKVQEEQAILDRILAANFAVQSDASRENVKKYLAKIEKITKNIDEQTKKYAKGK
eukprot:TRINITY_DN12197_c0_g2_i1.p1 TRINITY_DN12197_c0_g2~~TRINITY_DN12197_c0_g2_i1.p1  ORF type:complete len:241 (-),score=92.50 TRINITY_DN12197_c0_g2_i1:92-814(-)